jgi:hypothetical protein
MKVRTLALAGLLLAGVSALAPPPARAVVCALDDAPGATLLLPYFEVDLDRPNGRTTLLSINNASDRAVLTNVTLWSDLGVPVLYFQLYLTGFDVQTINLRDALVNGLLPRTASAGQDPSDHISPQGDLSQDIDVASCTGILPLPALPASFIAHLQAALTGRFSTVLNGCAGRDLGDHVARGYATIDTVSRCELKSPADPGYFGPGGVATNQNVLWGDFFLIDRSGGDAQGDNLVRLEADPAAFPPGSATFYGRYTGGTAADAREPLPSIWAVRYLSSATFNGGTDLLAWRDSGQINRPFACGSSPSWYPMLLHGYRAFDEEENPYLLPVFPFDPPLPPLPLDLLGAESTRFHVGLERNPIPFPFGWLYIDLDIDSQPYFPIYQRPSQGWVGTLMSATARFSIGASGTPLNDACGRPPGPAPVPGAPDGN